ncbi:MAG: TIGR03086 family metal-binding protein [Jatrophihabitans sp.]
MDDHLSNFLAAQQAFGARVHAVTEDQWRLGTPDVEWSVADLVGHLVNEHRWAAPLVHGHDTDTAGTIVTGTRELPADGGTGANLAESWDEAGAASADAFSGDGALGRTVELSRGRTPATDYISEMIFDLIVHSWDLQTAIGFTGELPVDVVEAVYTDAKNMGDLSSSGLFGAPVDVPEDAPTVDKLVALTGRTPR